MTVTQVLTCFGMENVVEVNANAEKRRRRRRSKNTNWVSAV